MDNPILTRPRVLTLLFCVLPVIPIAIGNTTLLQKNTQNVYLISTTFGVVFITSLLLVITGTWKLSDLGFRSKNFFEGIWWHVLAVVAGLIFAGPYARLLGFTETVNLTKAEYLQVLKWNVLFCATQEFMYRSFLMKIGDDIFGKGSIVNLMLNIFLFVGMHSIFPNQVKIMLFVLPGGIIFTSLYNRYRNLSLVIGVHTVYSLIAFHHVIFRY